MTSLCYTKHTLKQLQRYRYGDRQDNDTNTAHSKDVV